MRKRSTPGRPRRKTPAEALERRTAAGTGRTARRARDAGQVDRFATRLMRVARGRPGMIPTVVRTGRPRRGALFDATSAPGARPGGRHRQGPCPTPPGPGAAMSDASGGSISGKTMTGAAPGARRSVRLGPVGALPGIDHQRHVQADSRVRPRLPSPRGHGRRSASTASSSTSNSSSSWTCSSIFAGSPGDRRRHADHRAADDVGGGALDRRVDRGAAGEAGSGALGVDLGRVDLAPEQGRDDSRPSSRWRRCRPCRP